MDYRITGKSGWSEIEGGMREKEWKGMELSEIRNKDWIKGML